ncbi:unnamed protein product [Heligmosomoides polygyrus]|uniref:Beta-lactamase domain-containing protein n=1 Tax=Heligmosomoides polygyrus TaxID=6339 RepID=A0A3P7YMD4_HELPZ|nr:unnamed protein product [Heligmosomoides polygyrus]
MGWLTYSILLGGIALVAHLVVDKLHTKLPLHFGGQAEKGYKDVQKAFEQNFIDGWEPEGASLAVFVKGRKVVDVWGGYADKQAARKWKHDTISVTFSTTKAVAAVCIAMLADRGRLKYDDPVSKHWPGFAKNNKGNITIEWVLSHMSGLPYLDAQISEEMALDHNLMRGVLEAEAPKYPPGRSTGYHAFTYGWLADQIVRHTDEKHRGIGQFLREEIAKPNGIDYHIGLNSSEEHRVARVTLPTVAGFLSEMWYDPKSVAQAVGYFTSNKNHPLVRSTDNPSWLDIIYKSTVNSPEQHAMEQPAVLGIGNARSLASVFSLKTIALLNKPVINETDYALGVLTAKGHGFFYYPMEGSEKHLIIGHSGHGCQQVMFDTKNQIAFAYVSNGLKAGVYDRCRTYYRVHKAVYDSLARRT